MSPSNNIILIGMMGTGKSTVGRLLSNQLQFEFLDTDAAIEVVEGCSIKTLFEQKGEAYFRDLETRFCLTFSNRKDTVISTGGGSVLSEMNRNAMRRAGFVVWLNASSTVLADRLASDQTRPLLQGDTLTKKLDDLILARAALYKATAHLCIDTENRTPEDIAQLILSGYTKTL